MKENKLEVGDRVFRWRGSFNSYITPYQVVRLTPKRAILNDGKQVKINVSSGGYGEEKEMNADIVGDYGHVILTSDRLEKIYAEQKIRNKAKNVYNSIRIQELSIAECQSLIELFHDKQ